MLGNYLGFEKNQRNGSNEKSPQILISSPNERKLVLDLNFGSVSHWLPNQGQVFEINFLLNGPIEFGGRKRRLKIELQEWGMEERESEMEVWASTVGLIWEVNLGDGWVL